MTPAQRLARLPGCWREGMRTMTGRRAYTIRGCALFVDERDSAVLIQPSGSRHGDVPDLTDPATAGCIEEWARELYADPHLHAVPVMGRVSDGEPAIRWRLARFGGDSLIVDGPDGRRRLEEPTRLGVWAAAILAKLEPK